MDAKYTIILTTIVIISFIVVLTIHSTTERYTKLVVSEYITIYNDKYPETSKTEKSSISYNKQDIAFNDTHQVFDLSMYTSNNNRTIEIIGNTNTNPIKLSSCILDKLIIRDMGYVTIHSNTTIKVKSILIQTGGVLHIMSDNIDIDFTSSGHGIDIETNGTLHIDSNSKYRPYFQLGKNYNAQTDNGVRIPDFAIPWPVNSKVVITSYTDDYRNDTNPVGGLPTWFDNKNKHLRIANEEAIKEWVTMTNNEGIEVATISSHDNSDHMITFKHPMKFNHRMNGHIALLSRPIRIFSSSTEPIKTKIIPYPETSPEKEAPDTKRHWAYGMDGVDGNYINVSDNGHLYMDGVELWRMGSKKHYPIMIERGGYATIQNSSLWSSFSRFITVQGDAIIRKCVCFWSMMSGIHVEYGSNTHIEDTIIIGTHNAMPNTYWNNRPYEILPHHPLDFYMTASIWIDEPSTICNNNILCCSPSPVVGIWSNIKWVPTIDSVSCDDCMVYEPLQSYQNNTCYNMEGFWSGIPDGRLVVNAPNVYSMYLPDGIRERIYLTVTSGIRESRWMTGTNTHMYNLGQMNWSSITLNHTPSKDTWDKKTFFVLCENTRTQASICNMRNIELQEQLNEQLNRIRGQYEHESDIATTIRHDLEAEVDMLRDDIEDFKRKLEQLETLLNAKMFTGKLTDEVGVSRSMFFKDEYLEDKDKEKEKEKDKEKEKEKM